MLLTINEFIHSHNVGMIHLAPVVYLHDNFLMGITHLKLPSRVIDSCPLLLECRFVYDLHGVHFLMRFFILLKHSDDFMHFGIRSFTNVLEDLELIDHFDPIYLVYLHFFSKEDVSLR